MTSSNILVGASSSPARPIVRRISTSDIYYALRRGIDDFIAVPSHAVFLCVIYPLLGLLLIGITLGNSMALVPLAFPLAAGFALVGPLAAIGLYELSRRRAAGLDSSSGHALDVLHSPSARSRFHCCSTATSARRSRSTPRFESWRRTRCRWRCGD